MKKKKKKGNYKKKYIVLVLVIICLFIIAISFLKDSDGMENSGINKISYRTYTKENGWSKWSKNGIISGNKTNPIRKIEIKIRGKDGYVYSTYSAEKKWSDIQSSDSNTIIEDGNDLKAIKMSLYYGSSKYYDLCYRTYNKKNKWLEWNCDNNGISGNANENITAIEFKMIPNKVVKNEYLKDYNLNKNPTNLNFD